MVHGQIISVAHNSAPDPESQYQREARDTAVLSRSGGLVYVARIAMDDPMVMIDGARTKLEPGMAVTAEIKAGRRTVVDYLLSPIARRVHDALRERSGRPSATANAPQLVTIPQIASRIAEM